MSTTSIQEFLNTELGNISITRIIISLVIVIVGFLLVGFISKMITKGLDKTELDDKTKRIILRFFQIIAYVLIISVAINTLGIDTTSIATLVFIISLVITLSVQNLVENFVGGISIRNSKSFKVGDYIKTNDTVGDVIEGTYTYTKIKTEEGLVVTIPNKILADSAIVNYVDNKARRVMIKVQAEYNHDPKVVKEAIMKAIDSIDNILQDHTKKAFVNSFMDSGIEYGALCFTRHEHYYQVLNGLHEAIYDEFAKQGIKIPYKHVDVKILNNEKDKNE